MYAGLVDFWHQNVDFFEYMQFLCTDGSQNHTFLASHAGFGEVQVTKPAEGMQF